MLGVRNTDESKPRRTTIVVLELVGGIAGALLYSRNEAIIITEFLRRYFSDAYSKPRSRGTTKTKKPFTVRTSLPSYSDVQFLVHQGGSSSAAVARAVRTPHRTSISGCASHHSTRSSLEQEEDESSYSRSTVSAFRSVNRIYMKLSASKVKEDNISSSYMSVLLLKYYYIRIAK